ncbi:hypothetical protein [[Eubacterium] hominis]|uniref:hypothetical protein n=1 Tax=[Eubacterium] hominis TaxID=2764325 RepID=UPI0022E541F2
MATRYDVKYFNRNGVGWNYDGKESFNLYELGRELSYIASKEIEEHSSTKDLPDFNDILIALATSEVDEVEFQYLSGCSRIVITVEGAYDE